MPSVVVFFYVQTETLALEKEIYKLMNFYLHNFFFVFTKNITKCTRYTSRKRKRKKQQKKEILYLHVTHSELELKTACRV